MTMQQFSIPCDFGGKKIPCTFYIGQPEESHHPLFFQADWISKERGGVVPKEVMDSIQKLHEIALRNNVPLVELCKHALISANHSDAEVISAPVVNSEMQASTEAPADSDDSEAEARILEEEKSALVPENANTLTAEDLNKEEKETIREEMLSTEAEFNMQKKKKSSSI